jgi:hypothetical protein
MVLEQIVALIVDLVPNPIFVPLFSAGIECVENLVLRDA